MRRTVVASRLQVQPVGVRRRCGVRSMADSARVMLAPSGRWRCHQGTVQGRLQVRESPDWTYRCACPVKWG